ncbi:MAG: ABC transporter ATP-binding protein [Rhodothermia bacterium]|nr:MAG: ABC transporter ATP-binding protein [Rhodothermia bacterium]
MSKSVFSVKKSDVVLTNVSKSFGAVEAVRGVSLDVSAGSFFSLLGPSGCGKSTTLRMIAGFELPDFGQISIGGEDVTSRPPQRRPTAMVFQNYALFPHMTVGENVEYGLRVRRIEKSKRKERVLSSLGRVEMEMYANVPVTELSGGQQQRVALARAVAIQPDVLLFDEPLSNLDVALREQTRRELKQMQSSLGLTSIYVTHDQEEALALSDKLAVMKDGSIVQVGTPRELYDSPKSAFVAQFLGGANVLYGIHAEQIAGKNSRNGEMLAIRPESIAISDEGRFEGRIIERQFLGRTSDLWVEWEKIQIRISVQADQPLAEQIRFDVSSFSWVASNDSSGDQATMPLGARRSNRLEP